MTGLNFLKNYDGRRVEREFFWNTLENQTNKDAENDEDADEAKERVAYDIEGVEPEGWTAVDPQLPAAWRARDWAARPARFVDGKDVGQTVAWLKNPATGCPVAIRLAEIGSVAMRVTNGELRREFSKQERVVAMDTSGFPWEEVENFAVALLGHNLRLLSAPPVPADLALGFERVERIRRQAQDRSRQEMSVLEELALANDNSIPTIVDGNLKQNESGFDAETSPVFGLVKTHRRTYLHDRGHEILFGLAEGQRTPAFSFDYDTSRQSNRSRLPIVAWYVRLCGGDLMPTFGLVRLEVSRLWFENQNYLDGAGKVNARGKEFINQLSRTVHEYRCRRSDYKRAAISLEPIVRAEESLGALFSPPNRLRSGFYRITGL